MSIAEQDVAGNFMPAPTKEATGHKHGYPSHTKISSPGAVGGIKCREKHSRNANDFFTFITNTSTKSESNFLFVEVTINDSETMPNTLALCHSQVQHKLQRPAYDCPNVRNSLFTALILNKNYLKIIHINNSQDTVMSIRITVKRTFQNLHTTAGLGNSKRHQRIF